MLLKIIGHTCGYEKKSCLIYVFIRSLYIVIVVVGGGVVVVVVVVVSNTYFF